MYTCYANQCTQDVKFCGRQLAFNKSANTLYFYVSIATTGKDESSANTVCLVFTLSRVQKSDFLGKLEYPGLELDANN